MRTSNKKKVELSLLFVCLLVVQACLSPAEGTGTTIQPPAEDVQLQSVDTADQPDEVGTRVYLEDVIPPCTPVAGSDRDPCETEDPTTVADVNVGAAGSAGLPDPVTTITDLFFGRLNPDEPMYSSLLPHIVVRGTVQPGTSRCKDYRMKPQEYVRQYSSGAEIVVHVHCFADVRINEYLVGEGPPKLAVSLHRQGLLLPTEDGYRDNFIAIHGGEEQWVDNAFEFPAQRTAAAYEGKELVLFLRIPATIAVEAWSTELLLAVWFVQRSGDDPPRAVSRDIDLAFTAEQRAGLDMPLAELERQVRAASANRIAVTGGRIGISSDLPMLVTDANDLRTYYETPSVGVSYETDAPALPPPAPGEEEPPGPAGNTGGGTTPNSVPTPGDETRPSPGDDDQPPNSVP